MRTRPEPKKYAVARTWTTNLESLGQCYEIVYDDERRLIAGFVFVHLSGAADYREVDGSPISRSLSIKGVARGENAALLAGLESAVRRFNDHGY